MTLSWSCQSWDKFHQRFTKSRGYHSNSASYYTSGFPTYFLFHPLLGTTLFLTPNQTELWERIKKTKCWSIQWTDTSSPICLIWWLSIHPAGLILTIRTYRRVVLMLLHLTGFVLEMCPSPYDCFFGILALLFIFICLPSSLTISSLGARIVSVLFNYYIVPVLFCISSMPGTDDNWTNEWMNKWT